MPYSDPDDWWSLIPPLPARAEATLLRSIGWVNAPNTRTGRTYPNWWLPPWRDMRKGAELTAYTTTEALQTSRLRGLLPSTSGLE